MSISICEKRFAEDARFCNFYAGGDIAWSTDGNLMYCLNSTEVCAVNVSSGQVQHTYSLNDPITNSGGRNVASEELELEEDVIYAFALANSNEHLATAHRSGLIRLWSLETGKIEKLWRVQHKGPVVRLQFSPCCKLLCSSGADSTLRVWDFLNSHCVCVLKGFPGPAQVVYFHPHVSAMQLYAVGADNTIYCWNYQTKQLLQQLRGHLSQVTALSFFNEQGHCKQLASVSRDKVLIIWELETGNQQKVIPIYEELEGVTFLQEQDEQSANVLVASANGNLKLVNTGSSKISTILKGVECDIKQLLHCHNTQQWAVVTADQNILIYKWTPNHKLECIKQLIGFNDEILDMCLFGVDDRFLAVATNSKSIKIYDISDDMNCKIYTEHKDTVLTLATPGNNSNLLLSAGKDYSLLLWELQSAQNSFKLTCLTKHVSSHTATVGCISFGHNLSKVCASVSQDGCLKVWKLTKDKSSTTYSFEVKYSALAHEKEINSVTFSPNNKMLATASQDRTVKLWSSDSQVTLGTLRGHTRGVWCVRFSPVDQVLLTSSSDCSLRLWSLATMSCLKRMELECSVLRAEFLDHGKFIVSAGSDGLLKMWQIKSNACIQTLDVHTQRIWSLAVSARSQKYFYSGGADSKLVRWRDVTEEARHEDISKRQLQMQQEQALQTLLQQEQLQHLQQAFVLALTLGKPRVSYDIISRLLQRRDVATLKKLISGLSNEQRIKLLDHVKQWYTSTRYCHVANAVLEHILVDIMAHPKQQRVYNAKHLVEVLLPYAQRHFKRLTELQKQLAFLDFMVGCL